jgi:hypothetical protein
MVDTNDASHRHVFAGSVGGGLWKNNDVSSSYSPWTPVNDFFANIAVTSIVYNPLKYTGVLFRYRRRIFQCRCSERLGIWKSADGGTTWNQLASTNNSNFYYVNRLVVHPVTGDIYAATNSGVFRSQNAGSAWTKVLGSGLGAGTNNFSDVEVSSSGHYMGIYPYQWRNI